MAGRRNLEAQKPRGTPALTQLSVRTTFWGSRSFYYLLQEVE